MSVRTQWRWASKFTSCGGFSCWLLIKQMNWSEVLLDFITDQSPFISRFICLEHSTKTNKQTNTWILCSCCFCLITQFAVAPLSINYLYFCHPHLVLLPLSSWCDMKKRWHIGAFLKHFLNVILKIQSWINSVCGPKATIRCRFLLSFFPTGLEIDQLRVHCVWAKWEGCTCFHRSAQFQNISRTRHSSWHYL